MTTASPIRRRRTQQERREEAEERLLKAAMELVTLKGVAGLTLGEVGERAGYSRGLPAHHFGNKEGLLRALATYLRNRFSEANANRTPKPRAGLDAILKTIDLYLLNASSADRNSPGRAFHAILTEATVTRGVLLADVQALNRTTTGFLEMQLRAGIQSGEIRPEIDPVAQATVIAGMLRGIVSILFAEDAAVDPDRVRQQAIEMVRQALANPDQPGRI
ncbi:helix-turn-helix transcriptional regulator [Verticiella sediminum]|uniref:Helix-turn-helix transcriptional regulator n=1 Tax=Verticiella sediminum TaxID=1247510 RepID=A0A556B242_9BURK|nr:TetR/AcrR family transcriptional regulator [Verticiella sediminum]TSH99257.1 helix-turn-helix transcriptional regulator [Verticiella sediminum]